MRNSPRRWAELLGGPGHGLTMIVKARTKWINLPIVEEGTMDKPLMIGMMVYERLPRVFDEGHVEKFIPQEMP